MITLSSSLGGRLVFFSVFHACFGGPKQELKKRRRSRRKERFHEGKGNRCSVLFFQLLQRIIP